jgi:hypothetical protein
MCYPFHISDRVRKLIHDPESGIDAKTGVFCRGSEW